MAKVTKRAFLKNERLVVMRKNQPMFEITPISVDDIAQITFAKEIEKAEKDVREGKFYTQEQVEKMLGI